MAISLFLIDKQDFQGSIYSPVPQIHVFGPREEVSRESTCGPGESVQTQHRKGPRARHYSKKDLNRRSLFRPQCGQNVEGFLVAGGRSRIPSEHCGGSLEVPMHPPCDPKSDMASKNNISKANWRIERSQKPQTNNQRKQYMLKSLDNRQPSN